jgi:hypothetical protein
MHTFICLQGSHHLSLILSSILYWYTSSVPDTRPPSYLHRVPPPVPSSLNSKPISPRDRNRDNNLVPTMQRHVRLSSSDPSAEFDMSAHLQKPTAQRRTLRGERTGDVDRGGGDMDSERNNRGGAARIDPTQSRQSDLPVLSHAQPPTTVPRKFSLLARFAA